MPDTLDEILAGLDPAECMETLQRIGRNAGVKEKRDTLGALLLASSAIAVKYPAVAEQTQALMDEAVAFLQLGDELISPALSYSIADSTMLLTEAVGEKYKESEVKRMVYSGHLETRDDLVLGQSLLDHVEFMSTRYFLRCEPDGFYESIAEQVNPFRGRPFSDEDVEKMVFKAYSTEIGHAEGRPGVDRLFVVENQEDIIEDLKRGVWLSADDVLELYKRYNIEKPLKKTEVLGVWRENEEMFRTKIHKKPILAFVTRENASEILLTGRQAGLKPYNARVDLSEEVTVAQALAGAATPKAEIFNYGVDPDGTYDIKQVAGALTSNRLEMFAKPHRIDGLMVHLDAIDGKVGGQTLIGFIEGVEGAIDITDEKGMTDFARELDSTYDQLLRVVEGNVHQAAGCIFMLRGDKDSIKEAVEELAPKQKKYAGFRLRESDAEKYTRPYLGKLHALGLFQTPEMQQRLVKLKIVNHHNEDSIRDTYNQLLREVQGYESFNLQRFISQCQINRGTFFDKVSPELEESGILKDLTKACGSTHDQKLYVLAKGRYNEAIALARVHTI